MSPIPDMNSSGEFQLQSGEPVLKPSKPGIDAKDDKQPSNVVNVPEDSGSSSTLSRVGSSSNTLKRRRPQLERKAKCARAEQVPIIWFWNSDGPYKFVEWGSQSRRRLRVCFCPFIHRGNALFTCSSKVNGNLY